VAALVLALLMFAVAAGCGGDEGDGGDGGGDQDAGAIKMGGILKAGIQPGNAQFDPVLQAGNIGDIEVQLQALEKLIDLGPDFSLVPVLAKEWSSEDGKTWKITLQENVKFTNGEPFTADDVIYSFDRLRSKELGSPMADVYANIVDVVADDPTHVTFELETVDSEFPASLTDYRTLMLCKSVEDPMTEMVGTGPFMLESFAAEDRAVMTKNPDYWGTDADGNQLPYLDGIEVIFSSDSAGLLEGLQGGTLNWMGGLTSEQVQVVEANTDLQLLSSTTNYCFELQIRCDQGPGKELAFRQALMAGTDRQAIIDLVAPDVADPGNGTLVGPAYAAYYLEDTGTYDVEKAKQLLADAGYADGVKIKLVAQTVELVPKVATAWQAQMKEIGVDVEIVQVPPDVFYADEGNDTWYQADFCIVDWGTRAAPITYFKLALTGDAPWNYSRWKNAEFDEISKQIPLELDDAKRADLYKQAQQILIDEVPMLNFAITKGKAGQSANIEGIVLNPDWSQTVFTTAHFTE
jgi:peptide/nickel transport system substrate-binding protein